MAPHLAFICEISGQVEIFLCVLRVRAVERFASFSLISEISSNVPRTCLSNPRLSAQISGKTPWL
jgi:hypothetical protein